MYLLFHNENRQIDNGTNLVYLTSSYLEMDQIARIPLLLRWRLRNVVGISWGNWWGRHILNYAETRH